jgi:hypothetical protein
MNVELSSKAFWALAIVGIVVVGGILFVVLRKSDPAAGGPMATRPFNPAAAEAAMTPAAIQQRDAVLGRLPRGRWADAGVHAGGQSSQ